MIFPLLAVRLALAALLPAAVIAAAAVIAVRGGMVPFSTGLEAMTASVALALIMPPSKMFWRCFNAAKRMGWHIVDYNEKEGRIEATSTSFWFGQVSDIVIRVRPAGTLGARFDMRAESETGTRDFGRNLGL